LPKAALLQDDAMQGKICIADENPTAIVSVASSNGHSNQRRAYGPDVVTFYQNAAAARPIDFPLGAIK
jgi:hypothetical protein